MDAQTADRYEQVLLDEVIVARGCTEPVAIALATAKARDVLGRAPAQITVLCSGNIIKNAMSVIVPNTHGLAGIKIAAALGVTGGRSDRGLDCLADVTDADLDAARRLVDDGRVTVHLVEGIAGLYIAAQLTASPDTATVELKDDHSVFHSITRNGEVLLAPTEPDAPAAQPVTPAPAPGEIADEELFTMAGILAFARGVDFTERTRLRDTLRRQVELNTAIADDGLREAFGASVGKTLLEFAPTETVRVRARARAAAGSDARMGGSSLPVMINSGSGNQGLTVSVPVIEYARELGSTEDALLRALVLANLVGIYQKRFIGRLSAFCGVVTAGAGAGAGIAFLQGQDDEQIGMVVTNTIATTGGMVCDGAKASCASKISISVENAVAATELASRRRVFPAGEGLVGDTADETIRNVGQMARQGMRDTDVEILSIMLHRHGGSGD